jgi:hypothetical protein
VICAASGWRPNKTAVEEMCEKAEEALKMVSTNDVVVLHLFDNVSYMARSEEVGDLPMHPPLRHRTVPRGGRPCAGEQRTPVHVFQECYASAAPAGGVQGCLPYPSS